MPVGLLTKGVKIMFQNFPYTDMHQLNLDWIIKIAKDFLDQYTHLQQLITDGETSLQNLTTEGLQQLQDKADTLESLLQEWYNTHSEDIANQLASALADIASARGGALDDISSALSSALSSFRTDAVSIGQEVIDSIPDDYTDLANTVADLEGQVVQDLAGIAPALVNDALINVPLVIGGWDDSSGEMEPNPEVLTGARNVYPLVGYKANNLLFDFSNVTNPHEYELFVFGDVGTTGSPIQVSFDNYTVNYIDLSNPKLSIIESEKIYLYFRHKVGGTTTNMTQEDEENLNKVKIYYRGNRADQNISFYESRTAYATSYSIESDMTKNQGYAFWIPKGVKLHSFIPFIEVDDDNTYDVIILETWDKNPVAENSVLRTIRTYRNIPVGNECILDMVLSKYNAVYVKPNGGYIQFMKHSTAPTLELDTRLVGINNYMQVKNLNTLYNNHYRFAGYFIVIDDKYNGYYRLNNTEDNVEVTGTYAVVPRYPIHVLSYKPTLTADTPYTLRLVKSATNQYLGNDSTVETVAEYRVEKAGARCYIDKLLTPEMALVIIPDSGNIYIKQNNNTTITDTLGLKIAGYTENTNKIKYTVQLDNGHNAGTGELIYKINTKNTVRVSKTDPTADFQSVLDAVVCHQRSIPLTVLIGKGTYEEYLFIQDRYSNLSFIGEDRDLTVIINKSGLSRYAPFTIGGNFSIENLTIKMTVNEAIVTPTYSTDYDWEQWEKNSGYAIHIDNPSYNSNAQAYGLLRNCRIYCESNSAIGLGVQANQFVEIVDCIIERNVTSETYLTPWDERVGNFHGALLCHPNGLANEKIKLKNNEVRNLGLGDRSAWFRMNIHSDTTCITEAIGNTFYCDSEQDVACVFQQGDTQISPLSRLNNAADLNA